MSEANEIQVVLGDYKAIRIPSRYIDATEVEVQEELARAQNMAAVYSPKEGKAELDDEVVINFTGYLDGEAFEGGSGENYPVIIGSNTFIPAFEKQLVGCSKGDNLEITVPFPENYQAPDIAGREALFQVEILDVCSKEVPPIDDALAEKVSQFKTIDGLRAYIIEEIQKHKIEQVKNAYMQDLMDMCEVTIPEENIAAVAKNLKQDFLLKLETNNQTLTQYLEQSNMTEEAFEESAKEQAKMMLTSQSILSEIAKVENVSIPENELEDALEEVALGYAITKEELVEKIGPDGIELVRKDAAAEKALNLLIEAAIEE